jgi:hypothetical protein
MVQEQDLLGQDAKGRLVAKGEEGKDPLWDVLDSRQPTPKHNRT